MDFKHESDGTGQGLKRNKLTYALILLVILIIIIGTIFAIRGFTSPKESDINSDSQISQDSIENTTSITQAISEAITQEKTDETTSTTVKESTDDSAETTITTLTENNATAITFTSINYADSATNTVKTITTTRQPSTQATTTKKQTTATTPKQTTKVTTTTTQPVTQPSTQPSSNSKFKLEDIATNAGAFFYFSNMLNEELLENNGIDVGYGVTYGGKESDVVLALLNDGIISDEVIKEVFEYSSIEEIRNGIEFVYSIQKIEDCYGTRIDYSKYTIDKEIGNYINQISDAKDNGNIDEYIYELLTLPNLPDKINNSTAIKAMMTTYKNKYVSKDMSNAHGVDEFANNIANIALGKSYSR